MSKFDDITAENMKKLATKDSEEINDILTQIKSEATKGETRLFVDYGIKNTTKTALEMRGFKVLIGGRYNETNTTKTALEMRGFKVLMGGRYNETNTTIKWD